MKPSFQSLAACALLLGAFVLFTGCSDQPFGFEDAAAVTAGPPEAEQVASDASQRRVRLETRLTATAADPLASGHARFESENRRRKFSTEVEDVSVDGTGQVTVSRSGQVFLTAPIQINNGFGDLNLDTGNGQQVPVMRPGDLVQVYNADGALILRGSLRRRN